MFSSPLSVCIHLHHVGDFNVVDLSVVPIDFLQSLLQPFQRRVLRHLLFCIRLHHFMLSVLVKMLGHVTESAELWL